MSQRDSAEPIKELYAVDISSELVSKISEKITPEVTARRNQPLEAVYPFVFMDAVHYKVKENHQFITKAAYIVLGIDMDGHKDILGIWIGENESAKLWSGVLNDLKNRKVKISTCFVQTACPDFGRQLPPRIQRQESSAASHLSNPFLHPLCGIEGYQGAEGRA